MRPAWREAASQSPTEARIAPRPWGRRLSGFGGRTGHQQQHAVTGRDRPFERRVEQRVRRAERVPMEIDRAIDQNGAAREPFVPAAV